MALRGVLIVAQCFMGIIIKGVFKPFKIIILVPGPTEDFPNKLPGVLEPK